MSPARGSTLTRPAKRGHRPTTQARLPQYAWEQLDGPFADLHFNTPQGYLVRYMEIGPELATIMLDANTNNRAESRGTTDMYASDMKRNDWPFVGSTLVFADNGLLLDGQHRLFAIEKSGATIGTLVVGRLPASAQRYIDAGRRRTAGDQLKIDGLTNGAKLSSIARLLLSWEYWREHHRGTLISTARVVEHVHEHAGLLQDGVAAGLKVRKVTFNRVSYVAAAAAYVRAVEVTGDPIFVEHLWMPLMTGDDVRSGSPTSALLTNLRNSEEADRYVDLFKLTRWWRAEVRGEAIGKIQLPRGGVVVADMPDMVDKPDQTLTELDEEAAEALEGLRGRGRSR
jgi:hypothetical protein